MICHQSTRHGRLELAYRRISNFAIPQNVIQSNNATRPQQLQAQLKVLSIRTLVSICIMTQLYSASRQAYTRTISYVNRTSVHTLRQSYTVKVLQFNTLTVQQLSKPNIRSLHKKATQIGLGTIYILGEQILIHMRCDQR